MKKENPWVIIKNNNGHFKVKNKITNRIAIIEGLKYSSSEQIFYNIEDARKRQTKLNEYWNKNHIWEEVE